MTLWFAIAALLGICLFLLLRTLRARPEAVAGSPDVDFYEAQLAEIGRQNLAGELGAAEAEAARAEAARRLLAARRTADDRISPNPGRIRLASLVILLGIPAAALPLYWAVGSPHLPAQPLSARLQQKPEEMQGEALLARVEQHLASNPLDARGQALVAPIYMRLGRFEDAVRAYQTILRIGPETASVLADLGEAILYRDNGIVTASARSSFDRALELDPKFAKARFFLALAADQEGNRAGAIERLNALIADTPDPALKMRLEAQIAEMTGSGTPKAENRPGN